MTVAVSGLSVAERLSAAFPGVVVEADAGSVSIEAEQVRKVALFLRDDPDFDCKYLNSLAAVDWMDRFEIVYHLSSLALNTLLVLKARASHETPVVPTVGDIWQGAHLQEREAFDLMGILFSGHPAMRRIFLWEGFPGHPLRKDFLALPGGFKPGLQRFPFEFPAGQREYPSLQNGTATSAPSVPRLDLAPEEPFPIEQTETSERVADAVRADAAMPPRLQPGPTGAGNDPSQAGGTDPNPAGHPPVDEATRRAQSESPS